MTELYRCKVIENMQGKHIPTKFIPIECAITKDEDYFYRGEQSLKVVTSGTVTSHEISFETGTFNFGKFTNISFLVYSPSNLSLLAPRGKTDASTWTNPTISVTGKDVWQRIHALIPASWKEADLLDFGLRCDDENATFWIQDIVAYNSYQTGDDSNKIFKILFPQGISAYEESWGMRFSRKQIPVAYGGIFQTTGAKGREFSVSGMLHEKTQNVSGIIQPMRKLNKDIPYYLIDEDGFNNNLWYPVNITDYDIKKVPSAPYLWKFAIDMEEYTENDV